FHVSSCLPSDCDVVQCRRLHLNITTTAHLVLGTVVEEKHPCSCRAYELTVECLNKVYNTCQSLSQTSLNTLILASGKEYKAKYKECKETTGSYCPEVDPRMATRELTTARVRRNQGKTNVASVTDVNAAAALGLGASQHVVGFLPFLVGGIFAMTL
ncbi:uncharacterized protein LOC106164383, partial [Lingula anatina]|uniref:Uncharacterized protein LOC106164383 n=1 Tax=Lingula anatina TaxID=7574 RepID=A0A1S3IHN8_LINAN